MSSPAAGIWLDMTICAAVLLHSEVGSVSACPTRAGCTAKDSTVLATRNDASYVQQKHGSSEVQDGNRENIFATFWTCVLKILNLQDDTTTNVDSCLVCGRIL